jgi:hypothetical protein
MDLWLDVDWNASKMERIVGKMLKGANGIETGQIPESARSESRQPLPYRKGCVYMTTSPASLRPVKVLCNLPALGIV